MIPRPGGLCDALVPHLEKVEGKSPAPPRKRLDFLPGARILSSGAVLEGVFRTDVEAPALAAAALPGQFVQVGLPGSGLLLPRPLSVHRALREGGRKTGISLLYRVVGKGTADLSQRRPGEVLSLFGPLGKPFPLDRPAGRTWLLAGGMGAAPLRFLCEEGPEAGAFAREEAEVFAGARSARELRLFDGLEETGLPVSFATDDGSAGFHGTVTELVSSRLAAGERPARIVAVGPAPLYRSLAALVAGRGVECVVSLEARMACGVGVCRGCVVKAAGEDRYLSVCSDGPVFGIEEVDLG